MLDVKMVKGYIPGSIGRIAELHGTYYHQYWDFKLFFEAKVATEISEFLARYNEKQDGFWTASIGGRVEGSIAIDGIHTEKEGAHLRWFIVSEIMCGKGVGNWLINEAIDFCRSKKYQRIYLWTFKGLDTARHIYEKNGFKLITEFNGDQWGTKVEEQQFELLLG
ncbi:GNAT family N-acetyltransferase [bacterium]|nr:GNAT family N-acetyltransferase [bacterium]MBU4361323.1 GNAT family N-acetyltransferase [bacterium]